MYLILREIIFRLAPLWFMILALGVLMFFDKGDDQ